MKMEGITESGPHMFNNNNSDRSDGNETNFDKDLFPNYEEWILKTAAVSCLTFILVGIPGNIITIAALARCKKVRNATAYFIMNLSACDLLSCCFNLPLAASMFWNRRWVFGENLCVLSPFFRYGLTAVSIFTVLAITLNRYVMIGHPRIYPRVYRTKNLVFMIFLIWAGNFGSLVPTLLGVWGRFGLDKDIGSCSILKGTSGESPKKIFFVVAFILPILAIVICYSLIFFIVRSARLNSRANGQGIQDTQTEDHGHGEMLRKEMKGRPSMAVIHQRGKMTKKDKKLLLMIFVIFSTFVTCHLPITILKGLGKDREPYALNIFGILLLYLSTCMNPIIYVVMSSEYRQAYKSLFLCKAEWSLIRSNNSNKT